MDGYVIQRIQADSFTVHDSETDSYFGIPILDRIEELERLRDSKRRFWIIGDAEMIKLFWGPAMLSYIETTFHSYRRDGLMSVYVNIPAEDS